jgi:hypothetical protein
MANNLGVRTGADATVKTTDNTGVHTPHQNVDAVPADPFGANADAASVSGSISAKLRAIATNGIPNPAGETHIGEVGASAKSIVVTPTVSASPDYSIDDVLGGLMTLDGMARAVDKTGVLPWCMMTCDVDTPAGVTVDVLIFGTNPSNSTFTDNGAIALNVADEHFLIGVIQLNTRIDLGTPAALIPSAPPTIPFKAVSGTDDLYAVAIVRGAATLNLAGTGDVNFHFSALLD